MIRVSKYETVKKRTDWCSWSPLRHLRTIEIMHSPLPSLSTVLRSWPLSSNQKYTEGKKLIGFLVYGHLYISPPFTPRLEFMLILLILCLSSYPFRGRQSRSSSTTFSRLQQLPQSLPLHTYSCRCTHVLPLHLESAYKRWNVCMWNAVSVSLR